jgi:hypothetical protein
MAMSPIVRSAFGCSSATLKYGTASSAPTAAKSAPPIRSARSSRLPNGRLIGRTSQRRVNQTTAETSTMPANRYANGRPMPKPRLSCHAATIQPAYAHPSCRRSGR